MALLCSKKNLLISHLIQSKAKALNAVYKLYIICTPIPFIMKPFLPLLSLLHTILPPQGPPCCFPDILGTPPPLGLCIFCSFCQKYFPQTATDMYSIVISVRATLHKISTPLMLPNTYPALSYFSLAITIN